jgi:hypothetical protein
MRKIEHRRRHGPFDPRFRVRRLPTVAPLRPTLIVRPPAAVSR